MSSPSRGGRSADFLRARGRDAVRLPARLRRGWAALPLSPPHPFFRSRTSVPALARSHLRFRLFFSAALSPVALSGLTFHGQRRFSLFWISPCRSAAASLFAPSARLDKHVCPLPRLRGFIFVPSQTDNRGMSLFVLYLPCTFTARIYLLSAYPCPARLSRFLFPLWRRFLLRFFRLVYPIEHPIQTPHVITALAS